MHRSKTAHSLFDQFMLEKNAEVAIISEQYCTKKDGVWFEDISKTAAIWIPQRANLTIKQTGNNNGFVWINIHGLILVSCYLTPSDSIEEFSLKLSNIEDTFMGMENLVIAGDFNSMALEWGSKTTNSRGRRILDMAARLGLLVSNIGNTPTFRRPGCSGTIPDITLTSECIFGKLLNWKVIEDYNASDHNYITYTVEDNRPKNGQRNNTSTRIWNLNKFDQQAFIQNLNIRLYQLEEQPDARSLVNETMTAIKYACDASMKRTGTRNNKPSVYWWTEAIANLRKKCLRCRREYTRARRTREAVHEQEALKAAKKELKREIENSKKKKWEELRQDLNLDPWGLGYKVVLKKLGGQHSTQNLPKKVIDNIVNTLFPQHEPRVDNVSEKDASDVVPFTEEEIVIAAKSLKNKKAPGPDGIPSEILKVVAREHPRALLQMYNACLKEGLFPEVWKQQHLVLISKGKGDTESPSAYRPLCMLDTAGKLLEKLLKPRIAKSVDEAGGLSDRQHGFRPRRSTQGAIHDVIAGVKKAQEGHSHSKKIVLLATLDVRNAFNSARWTDMISALETHFKIPSYLLDMIRSYLRDRRLTYDAEGKKQTIEVTSGAAQGSILGPELWNISYDEILKIEMPPECYLVGYADDVAAVIAGKTLEELSIKLNQVMIRCKQWLDVHGLKLATEKTELVIITEKRIPLNVDMQVLTQTIRTKDSIKYLGMMLDSRLNFTAHLRYSASKAAKITSSLSRLMANVGGPTESKRRLIMSTVESVLIYGAEFWADSAKQLCRGKLISKVQRTAALRVASAYRTVSESAIMVISSTIPIELLAEERKILWRNRNENVTAATNPIRDATIQKWQNNWNNSITGRWTAKLIPNIKEWIERKHGEVNYYLTQLLSGHGYFQKYLHKMGKTSSPMCIYEADCLDDAEHTFFTCKRWDSERQSLVTQLGRSIRVENITRIMIDSEDHWILVAAYVETILREKKRDMTRHDEVAT